MTVIDLNGELLRQIRDGVYDTNERIDQTRAAGGTYDSSVAFDERRVHARRRVRIPIIPV